MTSPSADTKAEALRAIVANSKRLLRDATLLQASGSPGSALSLAILAYEEAGKGHIVEHGWQKPKHISSHHAHRHFMAFVVLHASFVQKYSLDMTGMSDKIAKRYEEAGVKPGGKTPMPPMTDALRQALRAEIVPQIQRMSDEQQQMMGIEQRWLEKVGKAVQHGGLEKIRQSGLYLDTDAELRITGSPETVERIEVERWLWAATRVLNLLEHGQYDQPYSPLAELVTAAAAGDESARQVLAAMQGRPETAESGT
ncbi:AbiV family abortive infection protein [Sphingomonas sp.]|uniref:AbiV family abortive infection protein n=1 Tax=Sphingomonas sp. TaxID=28214 RepID=UPI003B3B24E8